MGSWPSEGLQESGPGRVWGRQGWGWQWAWGRLAGRTPGGSCVEGWQPSPGPSPCPTEASSRGTCGSFPGCFFSGGWEEPTLQERPRVGSEGRGLQGSVPPQAEHNRPAGRAAALRQWGGSSDGAPGGRDRAPRLSCFSASFCRPGPSTHPPQGPTCLAGTPPQKCFPDETRARAPCGQLSRKALSTCHGGPLRRRAWRAWGAALSGQEQQLTTRAHTTVETPTVQLDGNSWKLVCTAHSRERPPLPPVLGVQGRAETAEAGVCQQPGGEGHVPQPRPGLEVLEAATLIAVGPPSIPGGAGVAGMRAAPDTRTTKLSRFPSMGSPGQHPVQN